MFAKIAPIRVNYFPLWFFIRIVCSNDKIDILENNRPWVCIYLLVKKRNKNPWCTQLQSVGRVLLGLRLLKLLIKTKDSKHNKLFYCISPWVDHSVNGYVIRKFNPKLLLSLWILQKILFFYTLAQNVWSEWPVYEVKCLYSRIREWERKNCHSHQHCNI